jgi:hypothetical protein
MRLFEVEDRFTNDLITVFRQLRGRSDTPSEHAPLTLPWAAVNGMLQNFGYSEIDTGALAKLVKQSPALNNEVKTFDDETGVTLKTKAEKEEEHGTTEVPTGPSVDQMARSGAKDFQSDLSK